MSVKLYREIAIDRIKSISVKAQQYYGELRNLRESDQGFGLGSNTLRAYRGFKQKPSEVYRNWAKKMVHDDEFIKRISAIQTYNDFLDIHDAIRDDLNSCWKQKQGIGLEIPYLNKMIDLFFKYLSKVSADGTDKFSVNIVYYGHTPLDKFSLMAIKDLFYGIVLSKKPSMGDVGDMQTYSFLQDQIRVLMNDANLPCLYFDYYAWNAKH